MPEKVTIALDYSHNNRLTLESSSYNEFTHFLFTSGYKLGKIQAGFNSLKKLEMYDIIILSSPNNKDLEPEEIEIIEEYVKNGGNLLIVSSLGGDKTNKTNLNKLTRKFGFEFLSDEICDSMNYINFQKRPILTKIKPHIITEGVKKLVFSSGCALEVMDFLEDKEEDIKIETLAVGGLNSWHKIYNGKEWIEEDCPKIPLIVAVEYNKGKVVGFGNLSIFSSLGREYGFSAFDNNIFIANILKWMTSGAISSGKIVNVNLNLDIFYWANSVIEDQDWENVSDVINVSLKYFKDNYQTAIGQIKKQREETIKKRKEYEKSKVVLEEESEEDKILEMIPVRKKEDLEDIMSALEEITGEKYELSIDLEDEEEEIIKEKVEEEIEQEEKEVLIIEERENVDEAKIVTEKDEIITKEGLSFTLQDTEEFEKETSKHAIWRGRVTKGFKEWLAEKEEN